MCRLLRSEICGKNVVDSSLDESTAKYLLKISTHSLLPCTFLISFFTLAMEESIFAKKSLTEEFSSSTGEDTEDGLEVC